MFKTEMMFMHPPRTRPVYGSRSKRVLRYGRGLPVRADLAALPCVRRIETPLAERQAEASPQAFDVDRAA
ncbi:MAG: hypothetical protein HOP03_07850 [Lysobacter sp.]|nr:hypothetical protein [Lysobacter sp.]